MNFCSFVPHASFVTPLHVPHIQSYAIIYNQTHQIFLKNLEQTVISTKTIHKFIKTSTSAALNVLNKRIYKVSSFKVPHRIFNGTRYLFFFVFL